VRFSDSKASAKILIAAEVLLGDAENFLAKSFHIHQA